MKRIGVLAISFTCLAVQLATADEDQDKAAARKALADAVDGQPEITGKFEEASDGYFQGYLLLRKADRSTVTKDTKLLREQAHRLFVQIRERFPDWKPEIVDNRIRATRALLGLPDDK